jgi:hypothetical protein
MIISIDAEIFFNKIQLSFMIKALKKVGIERAYLNIKKAMYKQPIANIIKYGKNLKTFLLK